MRKNIQKILIVVESINVDDSSGSKTNVALIQNLYKIGYDLKVMHYSRRNIYLPGIDCISIKENRRSALFILSRIERYLRKYLKIKLNKPLEKKFGFSFTLFNDRNSIISGINALTDFSPDLIITLSKGGSFRPHHALLKLPQFHTKWLAYIHDPYPMHFYPRPYVWVEPGYYQKWKFMKQMSEKAGYPVFPSKLLMEWMGSYFKGYLEKGIVVPHQIESDLKKSNRALPSFFNPKKFNLLHAGNLLHARDPQGLIEGFSLFQKKYPDALDNSHLYLIGNNGYHKEMLQKKSEELESLHVKEALPFDEVILLQSETTVNIILEAKSEISPFLPGKFPHCIQANKPILLLGPYYSESRRLLGNDYKFYAEIDEAEKISDLIGELYFQWKEKNDLTLNRPDLEAYLSEKHLKETIDKVLEEL